MITVTGNLYERDGPTVRFEIDEEDGLVSAIVVDTGEDLTPILPLPTETVLAFVPSPRVKTRTDTPEHAFAVALSLLAPYTIQVDGEAPQRWVEWGEVPDGAIP